MDEAETGVELGPTIANRPPPATSHTFPATRPHTSSV
jgi:hypothetical protein